MCTVYTIIDVHIYESWVLLIFFYYLQLFREGLSEKVHMTILKGIVGGFVCPVLQRKYKEWHKI